MENKNKTSVKQYKLKEGVKIEAVKINFPKNQIEVAAWLGKLRNEGLDIPEMTFPVDDEGLMVWESVATEKGLSYRGAFFTGNGTYLMRIGDMFMWGMDTKKFKKFIQHNLEKVCKD